MAKVLVTESHLGDIADAIRNKLDVDATYKPGQMAAAVGSIVPARLDTLSVTENGIYTPAAPKNGYSSVTVDVPSAQTSFAPLHAMANGYQTDRHYDTGRTLPFSYISGNRTGRLSNNVYFNTDPTKPLISLGSSEEYNRGCFFGPYATHGKTTLAVKYLPLYWGSSWYTANLYITDTNTYNNYSPSGTRIGTVNLGGKTYSVSYYTNLYGSNALSQIQSDPDHAAWKTATVNMTGYDTFYVCIHNCDMDSMVQSISLT